MNLGSNCNLAFFRALVAQTADLPDNARVSFDPVGMTESPFYKGEAYMSGLVTIRSAEVMSDDVEVIDSLPEPSKKAAKEAVPF